MVADQGHVADVRRRRCGTSAPPRGQCRGTPLPTACLRAQARRPDRARKSAGGGKRMVRFPFGASGTGPSKSKPRQSGKATRGACMFDGRWRTAVDRNTGPVGEDAGPMGVTADVLTASGLVFAVATAVAVGTGHLLIGIPLLALTGFHDLLDGPVAKAGGTASVRGAFFDSVTDRVADAVLMGGVAWYLVSAHRGYQVLLPLAVLGASVARLLRTGQGRGARHLGGQGRPDGASRADDPSRCRLPGVVAAGPGSLGPARPDRPHRRRPVRPGLEGRGGPGAGGGFRATGRRGRDGLPLAGPPPGTVGSGG